MNDSIFSMKDKVVLITGGSGYLGFTMSETICEYGGTLVVGSRSRKKNESLKQDFKKYNNDIHILDLDLSDTQNIQKCVVEVIDKFGKIDVLINNSYYGAGAKLEKMTESEWNLGIDGSINATNRIIKEVIPYMFKRNYGKIINISSIYGIVAPDCSIYEGNNYYNPANYGVGKAGLIQLTKYIAAVYGKQGITCNCISPGPFPSKSVQQNETFIKRLQNKVPLGRIGKPEDLKGTVALLASSASDYINGANIVIDGGWTSW